jgi:hypothetical protein
MAGKGLVGIPEERIAVFECFPSASITVNLLIELRLSFPQICFVNIPSYKKSGLRICGFQFAQSPVLILEGLCGISMRENIHGCDYNRREFSWKVIRSAFD